MQVQLIVADERHNGQVIPVTMPSFVIGRSAGCNLRSHSTKVSRYHCTILIDAGTVMVQDLGGSNGTFVNGNKVTSVQTLKDGDKLTVGIHLFHVSINAGVVIPASQQGEFFELFPSSIVTRTQSGDTATHVVNQNMTKDNTKPQQTDSENEVMFEIRLNGQRVSVTKNRLFDLARKGSVLPDDLVIVAGTKVFADSIQGIVFGNKTTAPPPPSSAPPVSSRSQVPEPSATAEPSSTDFPFAFDGMEEIANEVNAFNTAASERTFRIARRESAFSALWKALDISFSRVYTIEGNDLVIHSVKALYYIVVVVCSLIIFWMLFFFCKDCIEKGNLLQMLAGRYVDLSVVTFGCVAIIVVVRILLEMLLLAWVESANQDERVENDE